MCKADKLLAFDQLHTKCHASGNLDPLTLKVSVSAHLQKHSISHISWTPTGWWSGAGCGGSAVSSNRIL